MKTIIIKADGSTLSQDTTNNKVAYRTVSFPESTYQGIKVIVEQQDQFRFTPNYNNKTIKKSSARTGRNLNGAHEFRYKSVPRDYFHQRFEGACRAEALKNSSETTATTAQTSPSIIWDSRASKTMHCIMITYNRATVLSEESNS